MPPLPSSPLPEMCFESTIAETSQKVNRYLFSVYRQTGRLSSWLQQDADRYNQSLVDACVNSLINAVHVFNVAYESWSEKCLSSFHQLSTQSKQSAGMSILHSPVVIAVLT